jgi:predicted PurR-regulated permease PerM
MHFKGIFWLIVCSLFVLLGFLINDICTPFLISFIVAYFLNPIVDRLTVILQNRYISTFIIVMSFYLLVAMAIIFIVPNIYNQIWKLISFYPDFKNFLETNVLKQLLVIDGLDNQLHEHVLGNIGQVSLAGFKYLIKIIQNLWDSGITIFNILSLVFITPIIIFYILGDWHIIVAKIKGLLPVRHKEVILEQLHLIDKAVAGFIRGQINVCFIMSIIYSSGLYFIGIDFALILGIIVGFLCFIPYLGFIVGATTVLVTSYFQYHQFESLVPILIVLAIGQIIEGNFITPKLVGEKVGVHPAWIFFAIMLLGNLFGFWGVLLAVPISAIMAVLIRFLVKMYISSNYYKN